MTSNRKIITLMQLLMHQKFSECFCYHAPKKAISRKLKELRGLYSVWKIKIVKIIISMLEQVWMLVLTLDNAEKRNSRLFLHLLVAKVSICVAQTEPNSVWKQGDKLTSIWCSQVRLHQHFIWAVTRALQYYTAIVLHLKIVILAIQYAWKKLLLQLLWPEKLLLQ